MTSSLLSPAQKRCSAPSPVSTARSRSRARSPTLLGPSLKKTRTSVRRSQPGTGHQARQLGAGASRRGRRQRHPLRAAGQGADGALPHRRRAARDHVGAAPHAVGHPFAAQDHGGPRHRRAPCAAGRPPRHGRRRQTGGRARGHAAHRVRREDRHATARQVQGGARPVRARLLEQALTRFQRSFTRPYGTILVTGPTGSGKTTTLYAVLSCSTRPRRTSSRSRTRSRTSSPGSPRRRSTPRPG